MTTAVGIDLVAVESVGEALREHGERYLSRVYTPAEVAASHGSPRRLAERFAAKEAAIKALRPDPGTAVAWREIELLEGPELVLSGGARDLARAAGLSRLAVSVSAQGGYATAVVYAAPAAGGVE